MKTHLFTILRNRKVQRRLRWLCFISVSAVWWFAAVNTLMFFRFAGIFFCGILFLESFKGMRIPVLTYHSISDNPAWLNMPDLVISVKSFDKEMNWLKKNGYTTLSMDELYNMRKYKYHKKMVGLTFDDGYLDAWVAAEPVLKKHDLKGTLFVSSACIDKSGEVRPKIDSACRVQWAGYLNKKEICCLNKGGVLDIQSHGKTHDRIFCSDVIKVLVKKNIFPLWLYILLTPQHRTTWYKRKISIPDGYPVFEAGEALAVKKFYPDAEFIEYLTAGERIIYPKTAVRLYKKTGKKTGTYETEKDALKRWRKELVESKAVLEEITGDKISHMCWPRTSCNPQTKKLAMDAGYISVTGGIDHNCGKIPFEVSRVHISGTGYPLLDLTRFVLEIWVFKGHYIFSPILWTVQKIMFLLQKTRRIKPV